MHQHDESPDTSTAYIPGVDATVLGDQILNAEEDPNASQIDPQESSESPTPEESNPAIDNSSNGDSMASSSDSTIDLLKKHHLLRPRDVDALCDQRHQPSGLVAGFIAHRSLSVLVGDSGLGKSPLAYHLGICVSEGIPFLGMATEQGPVVYADYENALEESRDLRDNLVQFLKLRKAADNFMVWTPDFGHSLNIEGICKDLNPSLLIIDSLRSHNPTFEHKDVAGQEMVKLRSAVHSGTAILLVHHIRKPGQEGVPNLEDDDTGLMIWLNQAAGHRSIVNQSDTRIACDLSRRVSDAAMVIRWHRRLRPEGGPIYIERVLNEEGDPIGYQLLTGPTLLGNQVQEEAFRRLPERFPFKEAKAIYGRADDPTRKWLLKCIAAGLVKQAGKGVYQRIWIAPRS
jgi:hypothetical protein